MSEAQQLRFRRGRLIVTALVGVGILLALSRIATDLYVDVLWHREAGYLPVFLRSLVWTWGVRVVASVVVAALLFVNLRWVAARLGTLHIRRRFGNLEIAERVPSTWINGAIVAFSILLGLWFGAAVGEGVSRSVLLWLNAESWGVVDPFLGRDLSFYVFTVPLLRAGLTFLLILGFLLLTVVVAGYAATGAVQMGPKGVSMDAAARRHLGTLVGVFLLLLAARAGLSRPVLLFAGTSDVQGIFGFTDANARLPALRIQAVLYVLGAVGVIWGAWKGRFLPGVVGVGAALVGATVVSQVWPGVVQKFQVVPNELDRETPYIEQAIHFTRMGYGLDDLARERYEAKAEGAVDWNEATEQFVGLPTWSPSALLTYFREVEARFRYYEFLNVAYDRYDTPRGPVPVALAVREVDPAGIEDPNWQNLHLRDRYIAGNGAVAVPATENDGGRPRMYLAGIPPEFDPAAPESLRLDRSQVFFGTRPQPYALVNPEDSAFAAPGGGPGVVGEDLPRGIRIGGFLRKLLLAWNLREANLLFASEVRDDAQLVLRRGVHERVEAIAPFLRFPEAPYPVIHDGRIVWVLEGFTGTRYFPLSQVNSMELSRPLAWARNSVKVTVDAVTGDVDFWRVPVDDPIIDAWSRAFPELLKPIDEMPDGLRDHLRYSQTMLSLQAEILLQFHQEDAPVFFGQQDVWATPQELAQSTNPVQYRPEYAWYRMPGDDEATFQLTTAFVPAGRQNLTALLSGRLRADGTPELRLWDVPVEEQVRGPRQVEALIEQDPTISQQFSLWRTSGSRVWTGHLHLVPVGDRIVYMEPVFLAAEADAIPELERFVVSDGSRVEMAETLAGAIRALAAQDGMEVDGPAPGPGVSAADVSSLDPALWPAEALDLLDRAEERLRQGDFAGFGERLQELRRLLRGISGGGTP